MILSIRSAAFFTVLTLSSPECTAIELAEGIASVVLESIARVKDWTAQILPSWRAGLNPQLTRVVVLQRRALLEFRYGGIRIFAEAVPAELCNLGGDVGAVL